MWQTLFCLLGTCFGTESNFNNLLNQNPFLMNSRLLQKEHYPPGNNPMKAPINFYQKLFGQLLSIPLGIILTLLVFLPLQDITAQCGITPDPADPATGTIDVIISTNGTTVSLTDGILGAEGIAAADGPGGAPACQLYLNIGGALFAIPADFTCGTPGVGGVPPAANLPGTYSIVADNDGTIDAINTTAAVMINVILIDSADPAFDAGTCSGPPAGPLAGGAYSTNADGANNDNCRTAIPGLNHPGTNDNCNGETLAVTYDNPNDPANDPTNSTTVPESTPNTFQFYAGTTTVTYTITDAAGNTETCSFNVLVADNEDPTFPDPTTAIEAALSNEVDVKYTAPVAGTHSGRVDIVLNCNSSTYAADLAAAEGFALMANDNCDGAILATQSAPNNVALACVTLVGIPSIPSIYTQVLYDYEATDVSGNDLTVAGSDAFIIAIFTQDDTPPDFNPTSANSASVPASPTSVIETTAGTVADPYTYSGGTLTVGTQVSYNTAAAQAACAVDFSGSVVAGATTSALAAIPDDCQTLTFTSSINDGSSVIYSGNTNDVVTEVGGAGGMAIFNVGTYTITYTAEDPCGNASIYSFTLVIEDDTDPVLDCSAALATTAADSPYTADLNDCETTISYEAPLIMDNCSPPGAAPVLTSEVLNVNGATVTGLVIDQNAGGTPLMHQVELPVGVYTIRYTLTDGAGNTDICDLPVEVVDKQDPSIVCGPTQTINTICPTATVPDYTGNATLSDNCNPANITVTQSPLAGTELQNIPSLTLADGNSFTVTLTATQSGTGSGVPMDDCTFTVTIEDDAAPVPNTSPLPTINATTTLGADCGTFFLLPYTASNCDGSQVTGVPSNPDGFIDTDNDNVPDTYVFNTGFTFVTWRYDDGNGNIATQNQSITITDDTTDPIITINNNPVKRNTSPGECFRRMRPLNFLTEVFPTVAPFSDPANQTFNREFIDNCGVTLLEYEVNGQTTIARTSSNAQVELNKGSNIITFYATDAASNEGTNTVEIIVEDNEPPVASIPSTITLNLGDANDTNPTDCAYTIRNGTLVDPTATDNCASPPTRLLVNVTNTFLDGGQFSAPSSPIPGSLEGYTFTINNTTSAVFNAVYQFNDGNGQTITKTIAITVIDNRPPDITCPANTTRDTDADSNCSYEVDGTEFDLTAVSDNCSATTSLTITNDYNNTASLDNAVFPEGTTTVEWMVTDLNGKVSTCKIDVVIEDNLEPFLICRNITRNLLSNGTLNVVPSEFLNSFSDSCTTNPNDFIFTVTPNSFTCADATNQPIEVELRVEDLAGNIAVCRPTINVQETVAPMASCISISKNLSSTAPGMVTVSAVELNDGSSDNCPVNAPLTYSFTPNSNAPMTTMNFGCADIGPNPVEFYAIDASGNVSIKCLATITIVDATSTNIQCQDLSLPLDINGDLTVNASAFNNVSTDNCGTTSSLTYTLQGIGTSVTVGCNNIGPNNYVLEINDGTNTTTCNVTLTVLDQTGPTASCQAVTVNLAGNGTQTVNASSFNLNSMDVCSGSNVSFIFADGSTTKTVDCNDIGTNPITITVRDNIGNTSTCTTTLTVLPENPAVFSASNVSAGTGATANINITAKDYFELVSWQFSGSIDPAFATINSVTSPLIGGIFQPQFNATTGAFELGYAKFPSESLGDGAIVATINVTLLSTVVGSSTTVDLQDGPLALEIGQGCSSNPQTTEISEATNLVDGQLTIANGQVMISGAIENDQGQGVENVTVSVTGTVTLSTTTDINGLYSVTVPGGSTVTVTPTKDTRHKNGISALDAALVQAVANNSNNASLIPLPTRRIAADPNTTQSINVIDAGIISFVNVISGATFHNPPGYDVDSWVFVDASHAFTNPLNPWNNPYQSSFTYNNVVTNQTSQNFTAIKMGDVTGDADVTPLNNLGDTREGDLIFSSKDQAVEKGASFSVPLEVASFSDLIALQATISFSESALEFVNMTTDPLGQLGIMNTDLSQAESGQLALAWYTGSSASLSEGTIALELNFIAKEALETLEGVLSISDDLINPGAWHSTQESIGVALKIALNEPIAQLATPFELFQNRPNPFRSATLISFNLPETSNGILTVYDISGRVIYTIENEFVAGYNEVSIDRSNLNESGVYFYELRTDQHTAIQKMTLIN